MPRSSDLNSPGITLVAGPPGIGKTTWINQFLLDSEHPLFYFCPGASTEEIDRLRVVYRFPGVCVIDDSQTAELLMNLPDQAQVYIELGFHLDLAALPFSSLPCRKVGVYFLKAVVCDRFQSITPMSSQATRQWRQTKP